MRTGAPAAPAVSGWKDRAVPSVVCMKWGQAYSAHDVNALFAMVERNLVRAHDFVCIADSPAGLGAGICYRPLPAMRFDRPEPASPWRKLSLFSPELDDLPAPALFLDLDVVVTGALDPFFDVAGRLCIIENWTTPGRRIGNSSVFRFEPGAHHEIFEGFQRDPGGVIDTVDNSQTYMSRAAGELSWWPRAWVKSFKFHCLPPGPLRLVLPPRRPRDARIIAFHGRPKALDARAGHWPGRAFGFRPATWLDDYLPPSPSPQPATA